MKKTITFLLFTCFCVISLISCKKDTVTNTVFVTDSSTMGLLTGKQWQIDTLYYSYTGPGTGTLQYARGGSSNLTNGDDDRLIFWRDGASDAFAGGNFYAWSWSMYSNDSTALILVTGGTVHTKILKLDATHLTYYDSTNQALDVLGYKP